MFHWRKIERTGIMTKAVLDHATENVRMSTK